MTTDKQPATVPYNFLIRGSEYLSKTHPDFKLVGRDDELKKMAGILMRDQASNVILIGPGGAGCSSLCLGLQASKNEADTPLDMVNKRFYWLDTDALFASGNTVEINESFKKIVKTLSEEPNTVLVMEDTKDFIEAARNSGCSHLLNALMSEVGKKKFQAIFEASDNDLESILKAHSDMGEDFTLMELKEPSEDNLKLIVNARLASLEKFHGIKASPEAAATAIDLTTKYRARDASLSRAQPERSLTLIDRAFTSYRQQAHALPPHLAAMQDRLALITDRLQNKANVPALAAFSDRELEALAIELPQEISEGKAEWDAKQVRLKDIYRQQRVAEEQIHALESQLEKEKLEKEERATRLASDAEKSAAASPAATPSKPKPFEPNFLRRASAAGLSASEESQSVEDRIESYRKKVAANATEYDAIMKEINDPLLLTGDQVMEEYSCLTGIPVNKLTQNEADKLLHLNETLSSRVYDQDEPLTKISAAVKVSRTVLKKPNKPSGAFILLGPPGVGKTETALALTQALYDDERALLRFDMSEYSEKNAVAKLIGAPPGYEGFEKGGQLTKAVRDNPRSVILFDEMEKAHDDTYDVFLQVLSAARLTDNHGLVSDFNQSTLIFTSNIGSQYFLDPNLNDEEATALAISDLKKKYRPEFLNRFGGGRNIFAFKKLQEPTIVRIAKRELKTINDQLREKDLKLEISDDVMKQIVASEYKPADGARGIGGFFENEVSPVIADTLLSRPDARGVITTAFDPASRKLLLSAPAPAAANQNAASPQSVPTTAAAAAFAAPQRS